MRNTISVVIQRLGRVTNSTKFIPEIDGLRFFAIGTVVVLHLNTNLRRISKVEFSTKPESDWLGKIADLGSLGVPVFFVISGFILALPFAKAYMFNAKPVNVKNYYLRRLTRLEPPYILSLAFFFVAQLIIWNEEFYALFPHFLASISYSHFFIYGEWSTINPVTWSLETEVQFYILAPLLAIVYKMNWPATRRIVLIFLILLSFLVNDYFKTEIYDWHLSKSIIRYLSYFLAGFLFADHFLNCRSFYDRKSYIWDVLGVISTFGVFYFSTQGHPTYKLGFLSAILVMFAAAFKGVLFNTFYTNKVITVIGGMCYSIYLLHYGFIAFFMNYTVRFQWGYSFSANLVLQCLLILPCLLIVCSIFFILFEKPFMDREWPKKLLGKTQHLWANQHTRSE